MLLRVYKICVFSVVGTTQGRNIDILFLFLSYAAVMIHNELYSVDSLLIPFSCVDITVSGSRQDFDEMVSL